MVSRIFKGTAAIVATLSLASVASAGCGAGLYCGDASAGTSLSSWSGHSSGSQSWGSATSYAPSQSWGSATSYAPSQSFSTTMSSFEADSTYGPGSISETYSAPSTYSFSGSPASVPGLGANESLRATNCPVNVHGAGEGQVIGCYNVVKPVARTSYYRVVRPVIYVRYPVPVAVPYTSPCHTVKHFSRYGGFNNTNTGRRSCGGW